MASFSRSISRFWAVGRSRVHRLAVRNWPAMRPADLDRELGFRRRIATYRTTRRWVAGPGL